MLGAMRHQGGQQEWQEQETDTIIMLMKDDLNLSSFT
jgi:hypothetical protein